jgi:hypothetical protein
LGGFGRFDDQRPWRRQNGSAAKLG